MQGAQQQTNDGYNHEQRYQMLEIALLEYVERYGLTDFARDALVRAEAHCQQSGEDENAQRPCRVMERSTMGERGCSREALR